MYEKKQMKTGLKISKWILFTAVLLTAVFGSRKVSAAVDCRIVFHDTDGVSNQEVFNTLNKTYPKGTIFRLPYFSTVKGYVNLGWSTRMGSSVIYPCGTSFRLMKDTDFYLVRQEITDCRVSFNNNGGTSGSESYKRLEKTVKWGTWLKLPFFTETVEGYENIGWTTSKGRTWPLYKMGGEVEIRSDTTFYLVRRKTITYRLTFEDPYAEEGGAAAEGLYGTECQLPSIPKIEGYVNMGWSRDPEGTGAIYPEGYKYKIDGNFTLYAVRKKECTFTFLDEQGESSELFEALGQTAAQGEKIILPSLPGGSQRIGAGWALSPNAEQPEYSAGSSYPAEENQTFYAVYTSKVYITYASCDGSVTYNRFPVGKGQKFKLSGLGNPSGYTMLGWSRLPNQTGNPEYLADECISLQTSLTLYAVMMPNALENLYLVQDIPRLDFNRYAKVIFVGDSRTYHIMRTMAPIEDALGGGAAYISYSGSGLAWLQTQGYRYLFDEIRSTGSTGKPIAVIFNHGFNDVQNLPDYLEYMKALAPVLQNKNCRLFYMSVNPHNNAVWMRRGHESFPEQEVRDFNSFVKRELCDNGAYTYIDTYSVLSREGYSFNSGAGVDVGVDDGVHYSMKTCRRIYSYCIQAINTM